MKNKIAKFVEGQLAEKKERGQEPPAVPFRDVQREMIMSEENLKRYARELIKEKRFNVVRSLNFWMFVEYE